MRSIDFCSPQRLKKDSLSISSKYCSSTAVKGPPLLPPVNTYANFFPISASCSLILPAFTIPLAETSIAIKDPDEINQNYIKLLKLGFEKNIFIGIATHDKQLIDECCKIIK